MKKIILVIGTGVILLWTYLRIPISFGELNGDRLESRDLKQHEKITAALPENTREYFDKLIWDQYQCFFIWLQFEDDYYGLVNDMSDNKGILLKLDLKNGKEKELLSVGGFACGVKMMDDHKLVFASRNVDYCLARGLLMFIDTPPSVKVLVDPMYWEYDVEKERLKEINAWDYWFG